MTAPDYQPEATPTADFRKTWRYKVGLTLIVGGHVILLIGIVLPFLGMSAAISGASVLGGEVIGLASIVFLGKEGFKAIKSKMFGAVKASYTAQVGRTRHTIGIILFCANVLTTYTFAAYAWVVFGRITPDNPFPEIWGLSFDQQQSMVLWLFLAGEITFLLAIYVLGADWWGRFRRIFVWEKPQG
jgi:hypothetical protein